jgi:DNA-binding transcriptional MerR regulator
VERLEQIVALKFPGLALKEIRTLLERAGAAEALPSKRRGESGAPGCFSTPPEA